MQLHNHRYSSVILLPLILLLTACSSTSQHNSSVKTTSPQSHQTNTQLSKAGASNTGSMQVDDLLYLLLLNEYDYWEGSPYRLGGNSLAGIDCSSLVQNVFKNTFNINLPRTTEFQVKSGFSIDRSDLQVGDLVFFKTGWKTRHVGIYMGENQFFHASTSQGVMISDLDNPYWLDSYWQSRRVIK